MKLINDGSARVLYRSCLVDGFCVGEAQLHVSDEVWLWAFEIYYDHRRLGYGKDFMRLLMQDITSFGFEELHLWCHADNTPGIRLYSSLGFEALEETERGVHMLKKL